jgi:hypothetical protein
MDTRKSRVSCDKAMRNNFITNNAFQFLVDEFGFKVVKTESDPYGVQILYQNSTTAVSISYEQRENKLYILLMRLINGNMPKYPIFIKSDTIINSFYLDDIINHKLHKTSGKESTDYQYPINSELENIILWNAASLKKFGREILLGDFSIFPELQNIVQQRVTGE